VQRRAFGLAFVFLGRLVKRICRNCKVIKRHGVVRVICTEPRHKQRQG